MHYIIDYLVIFLASFYASYSHLPAPVPTIIPTQIPRPTVTLKPTPKPLVGSPGTGLTTAQVATSQGNFSVTVLSLDMTRTKMITDTASDGDCGNNCPALSLQEFVSKNAASSGINGTYFCPSTYPDCSSKSNSFDFPVFVSRLNHWVNSYALGWNERRAIVYQDGSGVHYQNSSAGFSGGVSAAIINYPGLLDHGNNQIDESQSGLSEKQKAKNTKLSLCVVNSQKLQAIVAKNVTMYEFALVNKSLGCEGALNMDTGGSLAMIYAGRYIYGPGRTLPNAVLFAPK